MLPVILAAPLVVANASLAVTAPTGYRDVSADIVAARPELKGKGIIQLVGVRGDAVVASINFVPSPDDDRRKRLDDLKECIAFSGEFKDRNDGTHSAAAIVDGPSGKTCQITVERNDGHTVVGTLLRGPKDAWVMTCVHETADHAADDACRRTVKAIRFVAPQ